RGGTFTDVVARDPSGAIHVHKLLSEDPEHYEDAPLQAIRQLMGLGDEEPIPAARIRSLKMGTTLATNALLERKGAKVGLITTRGFADLLEIGYQDRPELFALEIRKPSTLAHAIVEVDERVLADGTVRTSLTEDAVRAALEELRDCGVDALAVLFLHSYAYPEHELLVERLARAAAFEQISLSHRVAQEIKAVGRGDTTMADAYLTPIMRGYIERLRGAFVGRTPEKTPPLAPPVDGGRTDSLPVHGEGRGGGLSPSDSAKKQADGDAPLRFMQSNGGLADADRFSGKDAILSGPAGGVVAYAHVCKLAGFEKAIGFDMGGTSTDVSRYDGRYERIFEKVVAGVRIKAPMMYIETVAAGGGSILAFDGHRFTVGPESAGAHPGPACYRRGGPAAVTDANLVLGRIQPKYFPACFGANADARLDAEASREKLAAIAKHVCESTGREPSVEETAAGFIRIANESMAKPIKEISVARGYDVQEYALACFGGAGAQHACAIADTLGMRTILLHPHAGVLSAYGMGLADMIHADVEAVLCPLEESTLADLEFRFGELEKEGRRTIEAEGFDATHTTVERSVDLRYVGVDTSLNVVIRDAATLRDDFEAQHQTLYGFVKEGHPIEVLNIRVETVGHTDKPDEPELPSEPRDVPDYLRIDTVNVHFDVLHEDGTRALEATSTPVYERARLEPGMRVAGPALIVEAVSTVVVDPGWTAEVNSRGHLVLIANRRSARERVATERDPVMLEVFNNLFMSIADQMGTTLERVSHSVNIKERLDFSCAIFTDASELVANAPHIPVHLGAMGESVKAIVAANPDGMRPGDVYATNDPSHGGSHLPDVTVVTPVFSETNELLFLVANRGHHADIGGIAPGSMPPFSRSIDEEGIVLHNFKLVSNGQFHEDAIVAKLSEGPYPARNMTERLSDLRAQIAANNAGARLLRDLCAQYGVDVVRAYMGHVRANAAESMRDAIHALPDGVHRFEDHLDGGAAIRCAITVDGDRAIIDFTGTDPQLNTNLNAPPAVTLAAVLYVFRTLIGKAIPLNSGCMDPIEVRIPEGSLLNPAYPAAVVGGNVETSQRVVDVLYGALGVVAASQGTMNNFSFGTKEFGYYDTICGGSGAGPDFDGASAVHVHMTNTRITDPEVLEQRYPVILREFSIRRGSGGAGRHRGGDGVTRRVEFQEPMSVSLLTERRV
ncbi:MAG: hydantoinase B/oxoprolinase family protein, partial [Candidatus Hydrogenedentes bacterium]|nr:hydantoinase B/oxoprolinase family protein [Candidatus Hydrogenedentota bacterium]